MSKNNTGDSTWVSNLDLYQLARPSKLGSVSKGVPGDHTMMPSVMIDYAIGTGKEIANGLSF